MVLVGAAHHRALLHGGVAADDVFDHGGEHLEAIVADDQPLDAGVQEHEAVLIHIADVAGVCPDAAIRVVAQQGSRFGGLAVIALHDGRAGDAELTALADGQFGVGTWLKHRHKGVHQRDAHTAHLVGKAGSSGGSRRNLGHAVALGQAVLHAVSGQEVVHALLGTHRDGVAASSIVADEGQILVLQQQRRGHLLVVGRHAEHVLRLVLPDQGTQLCRVQIGDDNHGKAQHQRQVHAAGVAIGNERGHDVHQLLAAAEQLFVSAELLCDGVEVHIGQHDALGRAGGAAGVHHHAGVIRVVRLGTGVFALTGGNEILPADHVGRIAVLVGGGQLVAHGQMQRQGVGGGHHQHPFHVGALGSLLAAVVDHVQADEQVGVHLGDVLVDALSTIARVHQIQGGTDHVGSIERIDDLRGHHADHGGNVAFFHADGTEGRRRLFDVDDEVGISDLAAVIGDGGLGQVRFVLAADVLEGAAFRRRLIEELGVIVFEPRFCDGCVDGFVWCSRHRIQDLSFFSSSFIFPETAEKACSAGHFLTGKRPKRPTVIVVDGGRNVNE